MNAKPLPLDTLGTAFRAFMRHPSPWLVAILLVVAIVGRIYLWVPPNLTDLIVFGAVILFWPVQEWLIHVVILHWRPVKLGPITLDMHVAREHRAHHADPWRVDKIYMPFRTLVATAIVAVGGIFTGLYFWEPNIAWTWLLAYGVLAGAYEWSHFLMHTAYRPKTRAFARLQKNHRLHHFKNENFWYGVVTTKGDQIFGTLVEATEVQKSETVKQIAVTDSPS